MHTDTKRPSTSKLIIKETHNYPIPFQNNHNKPSNTSFYNTAELIAIEEERIRQEEEERKRQIIQANQQKYKQNIKQYMMKIERKMESEKKSQEEKQKIKQKASEYNQKIREANIKRQVSSKGNTSIIKESTCGQGLEAHEAFTFNQKELEEEKEETLKESNDCKPLPSYVLNLRENMDKIIKERNDKSKDLNENVHEEINRNLLGLKEFRKFGLINNQTKEQTPNSPSVEVDEENDRSLSVMKEQTKKMKRDLQTIRYKKALRNLMIEKFKEKSIIIPNICSCGQLQRKLDTLMENKNVSIYSIINIECANNCIYYNNTNEYNKALSDIIQSVKSLTYDQFK